MKREEKLIKNTIILAIGTFLPRVASFIVLPILTGYMTQEEFGTYDLITVLVGLLLPAVTLQIQTAAFTNIFVFTLPVSIAALIILYFSLFQLDPLVRWLICIYFIFDILVSTARQIVRGLSRNMDFSVSAIIGSCGRLVFKNRVSRSYPDTDCVCCGRIFVSDDKNPYAQIHRPFTDKQGQHKADA